MSTLDYDYAALQVHYKYVLNELESIYSFMESFTPLAQFKLNVLQSV